MAGAAPNSTSSDPNHGPATTVNAGSVAAGVGIALAIALAIILMIARSSGSFGTLGALRETTNRSSRKHARGLDSTIVNSFPIIQYRQQKNASDKTVRRSQRLSIDEEAGRSRKSLSQTDRWRCLLASLWIPVRKITLGRPRTRRGQETSCSICTDDFEDGVEVRKLPCGHIFHPTCVDQWLAEFGVTCPVWQVSPAHLYIPSISHFPIGTSNKPFFHHQQRHRPLVEQSTFGGMMACLVVL
ncbi:hypothetical protein PG996_004706 [Apiospora saccharicola]|uniref:RING-type domain-containing protein n=1 Tax=Apiospora saccharicola TaxID=335842 RepID=A0ABR1W4X9_9PEZI